LGHPANFNGFRVLALLLTSATSLNGSQTNFARCLADSWAGTLHIHFPGFLSRYGILPGAKFTLHPPSLALSYFGSVTARHLHSGREPNFVALNRGRHLHSAGRPSRWALAHILVCPFTRGMSYPNSLCVAELTFLESRRDQLSRSFIQDICQPSFSLYYLLPPLRDTYVLSQLRTATRFTSYPAYKKLFLSFISERALTFTFAICYRPSVCVSVVCNVRAPYSGGSNFRQYFYGLGTLAIR